MTRTTVYRLHDDDGRLLYVGVSNNVDNRLRQHSRQSSWWTPALRVTTHEFPDRPSALQAEYEAIRDECPVHNVKADQRGLRGGLVIRLPAPLHAELKERAEAEERSMAAVIRIAVRRYLKETTQ